MVFQVTGAFLLVWALLMLAAGVRFVDSGSIRAVFRFGKYRRNLQPGLDFIIPLLERDEFHSTQTHQMQLPEETPNIDREADVMPPGKKPPYRITFKSHGEAKYYRKKPDYQPQVGDPVLAGYEILSYKELQARFPDDAAALEIDGIHGPITGEVLVVVEWQLNGDMVSMRNFIENVEPTDGRNREEEIRKRMDDLCDRALQEIAGSVTYGHAQELRDLFSVLLKERIEILVGEITAQDGTLVDRPWGIHIRDAYIKEIQPGRRVNEARADASAAINKKQETLRIAEGKASATRMQADADAYAEIEKGKSEAARIKEMKVQVSDEAGRYIAALDVAETVLPKANFVVVPGDIGSIAGVLTLGQSILKGGKGENTQTK